MDGRKLQGKEIVELPDLRLQSLDQAFSRLRHEGLRVAVSGRFWLAPNVIPEVSAQEPSPGAHVPRDSTVFLTARVDLVGLMSGSDERTDLPSLQGLTLRQAAARLAKVRLTWSTQPLPELPPSTMGHLLDAYRVRAQSPVAGTRFVQATTSGSQTGDVAGKVITVRLFASFADDWA